MIDYELLPISPPAGKNSARASFISIEEHKELYSTPES